MALRGPDVLVLRALGLGDLLTAVPALRALRRGLPGRHLMLATPWPLAPLAMLTGAVDDVLPTPGLDRVPAYGPVALAVNLHGSGPESHRALQLMRPGRLHAFAHPEVPEATGPAWDPAEHEVARWCRLVADLGCDPDPDDLDLPPPPRTSPAPGAVVLHPGAGAPARRWPVDRFTAVAAALRARGERVVVTGGPAETGLAREIAKRAGLGPAGDLSGGTSLLELAALVAEARLVICGDTGIGHLATAYRTPSVLLFGPTPPDRWGPPERPEHRVLWMGGQGDPHGGEPDPGLLEISIGRVLDAAVHMLTTRAPADDACVLTTRRSSP
ncbi:glycosyltransferase family 9 protein [Spirillospora sp. NPDC048911]|uniref:glycosyltransferase family 9 protein n=1 Tax=Spirillospora sp. NPDC048911 TaxID=3364527 RepID=UPI003711092A